MRNRILAVAGLAGVALAAAACGSSSAGTAGSPSTSAAAPPSAGTGAGGATVETATISGATVLTNVNGLNAPAQVGSLSGVGALFQGDLEFPPSLGIPIQVPVAAGQCEGGDGATLFTGAAEEFDRPVIHSAERVPFPKSC